MAEHSDGGDRLPPLPAERMSDDQRAAADEIVAGPRGELVGPFVPLLRTPALMRTLQQTGEYLRFHAVLPPHLLELCILLVAREWDQRFEWRYHCPLALRAGLPAEVIRAIAARRHPEGLAADAEAAWRVCDELHRTRQVSDQTFAAAVAAIGEAAVVELVGTAGYYTTLAMVMNTSRTPPPAWTGDPSLDLADE